MNTILALLGEVKELITLNEQIKGLGQAKDIAQEPVNKFQFVLEMDADGYADASWESIIEQGQKLQSQYWKEKEVFWNKRTSSPSGEGWLGSSTTPVIQIVCTEPEYFFHNTVRLPGRFQITCPSRWGSMLRFFGDGDKVLVDDIAYGVATNAPIGIYVEPATVVGDMTIRAFEQGIERVIITAMNGTLPVYLAMNQDRFRMDTVKILQHQGAQIGIKHGPILRARDYPFPAVQRTEGNVYLADPVFTDLQLEGPHNNKRPQSAIFASGNNMQFNNLNIYGWMHGIYCHGGQGRVINGLTIHHGGTADGRQFCSKDEILTHLFSVREGNNPDVVTGVAGGFKGWVLPKRSKVPATAGWHVVGESTL